MLIITCCSSMSITTNANYDLYQIRTIVELFSIQVLLLFWWMCMLIMFNSISKCHAGRARCFWFLLHRYLFFSIWNCAMKYSIFYLIFGDSRSSIELVPCSRILTVSQHHAFPMWCQKEELNQFPFIITPHQFIITPHQPSLNRCIEIRGSIENIDRSSS